jgi:WS/DGAT/MGAT family acyltransferase
MQSTDAFFWYAEAAAPRVRPLVAGLFLLDHAPDPRPFRAAIERLVARVPRLRQRVAEAAWPTDLPAWENDPQFDLDYHNRSVVLPSPGEPRALLDFTSAVFATPLDHQRPLWEGYLIDGLAGGRAAYFLKMHHSVMDGGGALALFDAMTQARRTERIRAPHLRPTATASPPRGDATGGVLGGLRRGAARFNATAAAVGGALLDPAATIETVQRSVAGVGRIIEQLLAPAPADPLAAACTGIGRRVATVTLSLPRLQRLKDALGVTLNDLVLATVSGALQRYHQTRGIRLPEVQCVVPVNLRDEPDRAALGNRVTAVSITLPVGRRGPAERLAAIRAQTTVVRATRGGGGYGVFLNAMPLIPSAIFRALARQAAGRVHLICSNVSGPPVPRYLAGTKIEGVYPFAPLLLGIPLSIAVVSYGELLCVGIDADPAAIPDPDRVAECLTDEVQAVESAVGVQRAQPHPALRLVAAAPARQGEKRDPTSRRRGIGRRAHVTGMATGRPSAHPQPIHPAALT